MYVHWEFAILHVRFSRQLYVVCIHDSYRLNGIETYKIINYLY